MKINLLPGIPDDDNRDYLAGILKRSARLLLMKMEIIRRSIPKGWRRKKGLLWMSL